MSKKAVFIALGVVIAIFAMIVSFAYLSGLLFLFFAKMDTDSLTFTTSYDYYKHYAETPHIWQMLKRSFTIAAVPVLGVPIALIIMILKKPKRALYGASRMATNKEAIEALSADKGVLCGQIGKHYLSFGGTQHILMEAPSRSGKGVGFVVPNCLNYHGSITVLDIKGENYALSSEFRRKHGNKVYYFNPAPNVITTDDGEKIYKTHRWNFLGYISDDKNERINDIQKIADQLFPDGDNAQAAFFQQQARSVFLAIVLYLFDNPELPVTPGEAYRQCLKLADKTYFSKQCEKRLEEHEQDETVKLINVIAERNFKAFAALSDNTASSVMGTVTARLEMWANPIIDAATSANDFDLRRIRKEKMSIYFVVTPDNIKRFAFLVNLFFQQIFDLNLRELPEHNPELKYPCLFLLDEFTAIGKIHTIADGIGYFAGYNLRLAIIIQSIAQLTAVYGEAVKDTFVTMLALRIIFAPKENKVAQEISESLGYITETTESNSTSKSSGSRSTSTSKSVIKRAVLWPHELKEIGAKKQINIIDNLNPVLCNKIVYYKDPVFKTRLMGASAIPLLEILDYEAQNQQHFEVVTEQVTKVVETLEDIEKITSENINLDNNDFSGFQLDLGPITSEDIPQEEKRKKYAECIAKSVLHETGLTLPQEELTECYDELNSIINEAKKVNAA